MKRLGRIDAVVASCLGVGYLALLLGSVRGLGYARDEGFYFQAATSYGTWFQALVKNAHVALDARLIDGAWGLNHEHPGLMKSLFALSHLLLFERSHLFAMEGTSYRLPAMALSSGLIALVYLWGAETRGRSAGVAAAMLLGLMPRFFYHAHLACFDAPIAAVWTFCAYAYWKALARGKTTWPILTGIVFGLALDTKHNAWFLPIFVACHLAACTAFVWAGPRRGVMLRRGLAAFACMLAIGPLVLYALWPWIWHGTLARLREYVLFHLHHEYYNMELFGENYWKPPMPRSYAWVMTAATVPTITLALFAAGAIAAMSRILAPRDFTWLTGQPRRSAVTRAQAPSGAATDLLWLFAVAISYGPWLSQNTPIFGGTKHWLTAYPFVALLAGAAFASTVRAARAAWLRARKRFGARFVALGRGPLIEMALGMAVVAAPATETIRSHPWGLTAYTPLVGGAAGAATLGLNRTFWGYTTGVVTDYLNREVRPNGTVYIHDTAAPAWDMLQRDGRLRRDIRAVWTIAGADFGLYHHELHMLGQEYQAWIAFGTTRPDYVAGLDGVPVIWIYRARGR